MTPQSLLLRIIVGFCATAAVAASGLRGASDEDVQFRRKLPPGQPNYGLTPSEHQQIYGYVDQPGWYGEYYYDGSDYERGAYGNPWDDPDYYETSASFGGQGYGTSAQNGYYYRGQYYGNNQGGQYSNGYYQGPNNGYGYYYQGPYAGGYGTGAGYSGGPQNGAGYQYGYTNGNYYYTGYGTGRHGGHYRRPGRRYQNW
mmetsp:Transcript_24772/g.58149  ORF Transcript_24772/g.58149 Transcript_24772/m.58149 type:complete len:199 (-) Transcript_24772:96-692(-)|eukprot:CAMPEP_0197174890 /NCGR_PEP_ID=MMETSP1423-20130617/1257_1 /TAXON_ID=476441 /ORGANISM="Pseudo-nitzschia heimii, Strain UNC1101" /LENGTH=198 /DNA_ID=CAMNT_0042623901 /DNA_START=61 /DNA_END=657 /DNA_ORIENTATION=-